MTRSAQSADNSGKTAKRKGPYKKGGKPRGRPFPKGVSGNPGGRPKSVKEIQDLTSTFSVEAVMALVTTMRACQGVDRGDGIILGADWKEVTKAAVAILNRSCGMPSQPIAGVPGQPINVAAGDGLLAFLTKLAGGSSGG